MGFQSGALGRIRTSDRSVRSRVLYPAELRVRCGAYYRSFLLPVNRFFLLNSSDYRLKTYNSKSGGEGGIRTLDTLLRCTPLAGERLRPLGHLSVTRAEY